MRDVAQLDAMLNAMAKNLSPCILKQMKKYGCEILDNAGQIYSFDAEEAKRDFIYKIESKDKALDSNIKMSESIWQHIIDSNNIDLTNYLSIITSEDIKKCRKTWNGHKSQFEPRLLCKMDSNKMRPKVLIDNNICILSVKNGTYALIKENIYIPLIKHNCVPKIIYNKNDSLILDMGNSETSMLDSLKYNNIFDDIIGEKIKYGPLLGGRHRCNFDTIVGSTCMEIRGSQYETDGCYETDNYICVVEAKSVDCTDFNVRQLYYPYREVYNKAGGKKQIICLFIYKDKQNIIHIHKYEWMNYKKMLDIKNIGYYQYYYA